MGCVEKNNAEIVIERTLPEQIEALCELSVKAWQPVFDERVRLLGKELYDCFFSEWKEAKKKDIERNLRENIGYTALVNGEIAGFMIYIRDNASKTAIIDALAVDPEYGGLGIGTKLCLYVKEQMKKDGMMYAVVTTGLDDAHAPARHTYEKMGFEKGLPSVKYFMNL